MIAAALALWHAVKEGRAWLTFVVVGAIGAWLYVQLAETRIDRDRLLGTAETICAAVGEPFAASALEADDKRVEVPRGRRCEQRAATLVAFRAETERQAAETLAAAMRERDQKTADDVRAARAATEALAGATQRMEAADAEAERRNQVDRDWWAALNDLAGLRRADR